MHNKLIIYTVVALIIGGAAGFFGGMQYQKTKGQQSLKMAYGQRFLGARNSRFGQNRNRVPVNGEILSIDNNSITVKLADGSSKIVLLGNSTAIHKTQLATKDDLKTGEKVLVLGANNADGSVAAENIQLNPQAR